MKGNEEHKSTQTAKKQNLPGLRLGRDIGEGAPPQGRGQVAGTEDRKDEAETQAEEGMLVLGIYDRERATEEMAKVKATSSLQE